MSRDIVAIRQDLNFLSTYKAEQHFEFSMP